MKSDDILVSYNQKKKIPKPQTHLYGTDSGDAGEQCDCCVDVQHFQFTEAEGC